MASVGDADSDVPTLPLGRAPELAPGAVFDGRYLLEREIGRGAVGVVFAARTLKGMSPVALKLVPFANASELGRVRREGAILADLVSPHLVRVLESGVSPPCAYVVMELLEGCDLRTMLIARGRLPPLEVVSLSKQLADGLGVAHGLGYVHRDLKPANIFLHGVDARVKLLDFGLAKHLADDSSLTATGALLGSPAFMSPEQIEHPRSVDHRADLWAYAVVLFRALTGAPPFPGTGGKLLAHIQACAHASASALNRDLSEEVDACFERALAKSRDARFQSAAAMHAAFERALRAGA